MQKTPLNIFFLNRTLNFLEPSLTW